MPSSRERAPLWAGRDLRDLQPLEQIGEGASAVVYRARKSGWTDDVALKIWKKPLDTEMSGRFSRELEIQRRLHHPRIVRLLWSEVVDDEPPLLVLDLYAGSLRQRIAAAWTPSLDEALRVAEDVLAGLSEIHRSGHLHRDVNPGNVLLTKDLRAAVGDFGLAMRVGGRTSSTAAGTLMFTAPELACDGQPNFRSDVFSAARTLQQLFRDHPSATQVGNLLTRASSENPNDRPDDASDLSERFARAAQGDLGQGPCPVSTAAVNGGESVTTRTSPQLEPPQDAITTTTDVAPDHGSTLTGGQPSSENHARRLTIPRPWSYGAAMVLVTAAVITSITWQPWVNSASSLTAAAGEASITSLTPPGSADRPRPTSGSMPTPASSALLVPTRATAMAGTRTSPVTPVRVKQQSAPFRAPIVPPATGQTRPSLVGPIATPTSPARTTTQARPLAPKLPSAPTSTAPPAACTSHGTITGIPTTTSNSTLSVTVRTSCPAPAGTSFYLGLELLNVDAPRNPHTEYYLNDLVFTAASTTADSTQDLSTGGVGPRQYALIALSPSQHAAFVADTAHATFSGGGHWGLLAQSTFDAHLFSPFYPCTWTP